MTKLKNFFNNQKIYVFCIFLLILAVCINASMSINACIEGLIVWATRLLPALFPFFFLTRLFASLGGVEIFEKLLSPITQKFYNTDGKSGYVFAMSLLSGYPVSAKLSADLYLSGKITRGQAYRTITFSSTSGPLFVITTVGLGMFGSAKLGLLVMLIHIIGSVANGFLYRKYKIDDNFRHFPKSDNKSLNILEDAMLSSINSILLIGGYVCFFFVVISLISNLNIFKPLVELASLFGVEKSVSESVLGGVIEITRGCLDLSTCSLSPHTALILLSTIVSWGGISINLQALTFLKKMNFSTSFYFLTKCTQTLITLCISILFCLFI